MPGSFSDYLENSLLNAIFRGTSYTFPTTLHFALYTVAPSDSSAGTEVANAFGYARKAVTPSTSSFSLSTAGATENSEAITFPAATGGSWGTVVAFGILDSGTYGSGNLLLHGTLNASKLIGDGDTASFSIGDLDITLD